MTDAHKEMLSHHLYYELMMLGNTFLQLEAGVPKGNEVFGNAYIEAFSVHARNLIEFFEKKLSTHYVTAAAFTDASYKPLSASIVRKSCAPNSIISLCTSRGGARTKGTKSSTRTIARADR